MLLKSHLVCELTTYALFRIVSTKHLYEENLTIHGNENAVKTRTVPQLLSWNLISWFRGDYNVDNTPLLTQPAFNFIIDRNRIKLDLTSTKKPI